MKKTKLLMPLVGIAAVGSAVIPMVACGPKNNKSDEIQLEWLDTWYALEDGMDIKTGKTYKFTFTPTTADQVKTSKFDVEDYQETIAYKVADEIKVKIGNNDEKIIQPTSSSIGVEYVLPTLELNKKVVITFTAITNCVDCYPGAW